MNQLYQGIIEYADEESVWRASIAHFLKEADELYCGFKPTGIVK